MQNIKKRFSEISRKSNETDISLKLSVDGTGEISINTGIGFFDHMLMQLSAHSGIDINLLAKGDTHIDDHHTVEDVGIVLGAALLQALGDRKGIARYGSALLPMDEALAEVAIDISGRGGCHMQVNFKHAKTGDFDLSLVEEFFIAFCNNAKITLHAVQRCGSNDHHIAEAIFKGVGRSLRQAVAVVSQNIPSTKGMLD